MVRRTVICPNCKVAQPVDDADARTGIPCDTCGHLLPAESEPTSAPRPATILWIDDDELLLAFGRSMLEGHGYRTLTALGGRSGIALATEERPDLIILDVLMPEMGGYEVCLRLRAESELQDTPILLLTCLQDPQVDVLGRDLGATFTMHKPSDPTLIIRTIEELLDRNLGPPHS
jgi:DNA-binding response OmpR family regulator